MQLFLNSRGETVQFASTRGKTVTGTLCHRLEITMSESYSKKSRSRLDLHWYTILHDNVPEHTSKEIFTFLKAKDFTIASYPPYSPDVVPCDIFLFPNMKKTFESRRYNSRQAVETVVLQCLKGVSKKDYSEAFQKWNKILLMVYALEGELS